MSLARRLLGDRSHEEDILCLAFSRKYQGRCFAGLSLRDGRWIRPVSRAEYGTLAPRDYRLPGGSEPRLLDVIRLRLEARQPEPHQPENHLVSHDAWRLVRRPAGVEAAQLIEDAIDRSPFMLGYPGDRIDYRLALKTPLLESLTLVEPKNVRFLSTRSYRGMPQARLTFAHSDASYSLAVTDPLWEFEIASRPEGRYPPEAFGLDATRLLVTISLGEPFEGFCFKLVAAIFERPLGPRSAVSAP